jgi:hypothetical protein
MGSWLAIPRWRAASTQMAKPNGGFGPLTSEQEKKEWQHQ